MGKLILQSFELVSAKDCSENLEFFYEEVYVFIGEEGKDYSECFTFDIISYKWLVEKNKDDVDNKGEYLRFALIMRYYDESAIENHLKRIIKRCNILKDRNKALNCLAHYLKYEYEEFEY